MLTSLITYIETEIASYMPAKEGYKINVNGLDAHECNKDFDTYRPNSHALEWIYKFKVEILYTQGQNNKFTRTAFDSAMELYRKAISAIYARQSKVSVTGETGEDVWINSFTNLKRNTEDKNYLYTFDIEYKHIELY